MLKVPPEKLADGYKGREAARNQELAERRATGKAARIAAQVDDSIEVLVKDAEQKARDKVKLTLEQLDKGERPSTNNYHQARIGAALMAIEALALTNKLQHFDSSNKARAEITASVMSLDQHGLGHALCRRQIHPRDRTLQEHPRH